MRRAITALFAVSIATAIAMWLARGGDRETELPSVEPSPRPREGAEGAPPSPPTRVPDECAVAFSGEPFMDEQAIALAVLDGFNHESNSVRATRATVDGRRVAAVGSCRGSSVYVRVAADGGSSLSVSVLTSLLSGAPEVVEDAGFGSSLLARVIVGSDPVGCNAPRGFVALVSLRDRRLVVDALGSWTGGCGAVEPMTLRPQKDGAVELAEPIDDQDEPDERADAESDEPTVRERRWSLRAGDLAPLN